MVVKLGLDVHITDNNTDNYEKTFLSSMWDEVKSSSSEKEKKYFEAIEHHYSDARRFDEILPYHYLLLTAFDVDQRWFMYDYNCEIDVDTKDMLHRCATKMLKHRFLYDKDSGEYSFYIPLLVYLILLKREYEMCINDTTQYLDNKIDTIKCNCKNINDFAVSVLITHKLCVYSKTVYGDDKNEYEKIDKDEYVKFSPSIINVLLKQHIENHVYRIISREISKDKLKNYEDCGCLMNQKEYDNNDDKRLIIDYLFPYSTPKPYDVFVPSILSYENFAIDPINRMYLALNKTVSLDNCYREPFENEKFKIIQILKDENYSRIHKYFNCRDKNCRFVFVQSKEDYDKDNAVKKVFDDFRHDYSKNVLQKLNVPIENIISIIGHLEKPDFKMDEDDYDYVYDTLSEINKNIRIFINHLQTINTSEFAGKKINVKDMMDSISDYVKGNYSLTYNIKLLHNNYYINAVEAAVAVQIESIIDNAIKHGYDGEEIPEKKKIDISITIENKNEIEYVKISISNNGYPIDVNINEYQTRGLFKGATGHTGIGGYRICQIAECFGGFVEIKSRTNEWNTTINIYYPTV